MKETERKRERTRERDRKRERRARMTERQADIQTYTDSETETEEEEEAECESDGFLVDIHRRCAASSVRFRFASSAHYFVRQDSRGLPHTTDGRLREFVDGQGLLGG